MSTLRTLNTLQTFDALYKETSMVNTKLGILRKAGGRLAMSFEGRPDVRINSLNPLDYEQFGRFRNRAPELVGRTAIYGLGAFETYDEHLGLFLVTHTPEIPESQMYGFAVGAEEANQIAQAVGADAYFEGV